MKKTTRAVFIAVLTVMLGGLLAGAVSAKPGGAGPGNSPNAKACQKGGWQQLFTSAGAGFTSESHCTSYAANGGTLTTTPPPDTTPPQTTIDSGPAGTIAVDSASLAFSSSEANSTFECKLDGPGAVTGTFGSCVTPQGYLSLADGSYTFSVKATDAAGNTDQTPATTSFVVDANTGGVVPEGFVEVCRYTGTPGVDEELQISASPAEVEVSSIAVSPDDPLFVVVHDPVEVGDVFVSDGGYSVVVAVAGEPSPTIEDCPGFVAP